MGIMNADPIMSALKDQEAAYSLIRRTANTALAAKDKMSPSVRQMTIAWLQDVIILQGAEPFAWSENAIEAVLAASQSVPGDALLNRWNLDSDAAWWWFEKPLPIFTTSFRSEDSAANYPEWKDFHDQPVKAMSMAWVANKGRRAFTASAWTTDPMDTYPLVPSQIWHWKENESLQQMLDFSYQDHERKYGPGGIYASKNSLNSELFIQATSQLSRFILAGITWLNQKILVEREHRGDRHARKQYSRVFKRDLDALKVVELRRVQTSNPVETTEAAEGDKRQFHCQWVVDGHFRNQACGPGRSDRKLIYIQPFVKGPENMPLRVPKAKVYRVDR